MKSSRRIIIAPYIGEFGWEVMNWQARVRWLAQHREFDQFVIVAPPDRRAFYQDMMDGDRRIAFCPCTPPPMPGQASEDYRVDHDGQRIDREILRDRLARFTKTACQQNGLAVELDELILPLLDGTLFPTRKPFQQFHSLRKDATQETDVLLVPRQRAVACERNLSSDWWDALQSELARNDLRVARLQSRLDIATAQFSTARLAVGASTGGLHLASLCECPHYVWGPGDDERWTGLRISNRQRYETIWNPLGTACRYDALGWQPEVATVASGVLSALNALGARDAPRGRSEWSGRWRWRARRLMATSIEARPSAIPLPWRVREYARLHLL